MYVRWTRHLHEANNWWAVLEPFDWLERLNPIQWRLYLSKSISSVLPPLAPHDVVRPAKRSCSVQRFILERVRSVRVSSEHLQHVLNEDCIVRSGRITQHSLHVEPLHVNSGNVDSLKQLLGVAQRAVLKPLHVDLHDGRAERKEGRDVIHDNARHRFVAHLAGRQLAVERISAQVSQRHVQRAATAHVAHGVLEQAHAWRHVVAEDWLVQSLGVCSERFEHHDLTPECGRSQRVSPDVCADVDESRFRVLAQWRHNAVRNVSFPGARQQERARDEDVDGGRVNANVELRLSFRPNTVDQLQTFHIGSEIVRDDVIRGRCAGASECGAGNSRVRNRPEQEYPLLIFWAEQPASERGSRHGNAQNVSLQRQQLL